MQTDRYAVYKQSEGAFVALPTNDVGCNDLIKMTRDFRSRGRAIVAKQALERQLGDGGEDAA